MPPPLPPPAFLRRLVLSSITPDINKVPQYRWDLLIADYIAALIGGDTFHARAVQTVNVPNLAAYTPNAANSDSVTMLEKDVLFLAAQTTSKENGPYVLGPADGFGNFPLTRPFWWASGDSKESGTDIRIGFEGSRLGGTVWALMFQSPPPYIIDTTIGNELFPRYFKGECTLVNGTVTVVAPVPVPIFNGFSQVYVAPVTDIAPNLTVRYTAPLATIAPGPIGTGQFVAQAERADGTVNVADQSILSFLVINDGGA